MINRLVENLHLRFSAPKRPRDTAAVNWLLTILLTSIGVTGLVLGMRQMKWLESLELRAYDQMLRLRPAEPPDPRILLVTITEDDIQRQGKWPLSDATYQQLLKILESYQPRVIGLNVYLNLIQPPGKNNLAQHLRESDRIIAMCKYINDDGSEIPPPPGIPIERVGFSDVATDNDKTLRRALLFATPKDEQKCTTSFSLGASVALRYLKSAGIKEVDFSSQQDFQIGRTFFYTLRPNAGSYQSLDTSGYQILLNYRDPKHLAQQVTLTQVLAGQINPQWVKDRLVIVGTTALTVPPGGFYTPYSASGEQQARMPAVLVHTQVASQILSTVLDKRRLMWYWSDGTEAAWIWGWAVCGTILGWRLRHPVVLVVAGGIALSSLVAIATGVFLQAGWIPVVPPALVLVLSGLCVRAYNNFQALKQQQQIVQQVEAQKQAIAQLNILYQETITNQSAIPTQTGGDTANTSPPPPVAFPTPTTSLLAGRYQITKALSSGGFGYTYLAADTQRPGNPICVVKQLMPARRDTRFLEVARRLFNTEAEILEALGKHNQIPELFAYFEENKEFYLVQEYIAGHALSDELIDDKRIKNEKDVIYILTDILEVLAFVHEHHVIHRDIKPNNIIRRESDNRLVLIDFGAVKLMQSAGSDKTEVSTVAIGTRGYAPPEQFAGYPRICSDIYAVGMIGIQGVTGIPPQSLQPDAQTGNLVWRQWAQISDELAQILDKMVRYNFSDRYQSAGEVLQELQKIGE